MFKELWVLWNWGMGMCTCVSWAGAGGAVVVWDSGIGSATEVTKVSCRQKGYLEQCIHRRMDKKGIFRTWLKFPLLLRALIIRTLRKKQGEWWKAGTGTVEALLAFWSTGMSYGNYNLVRKKSYNLNFIMSYITISDTIKPQHNFSIIFGC